MNAIEALILAALASPILVGNTVFALEVLLGSLPSRAPKVDLSSKPETVVLIPAHDEEEIIDKTLTRLQAQLAGHMSILLVADNCTDATADVARKHDVQVLERNAPEARGKGFALEYGREHLRSAPPQCVLVIDADCEVSSETLTLLAASAEALDSPIQGRSLMRSPGGAPVVVQVSNFATYVKNELRQRGLKRLGAPALLNGTGMAFPWRLFDQAKLGTANIVEDLQLGLDLVQAGERPVFLSGAVVWSASASAAATAEQRSRWEGGFMATAGRRSLPVLRWALSRLDFGAFWLGLHLMTPPLSMLVILNLLAISIALVFASGVGKLVVAAIGFTQFLLVAAVLVAWLSGGQRYISASAALQIPRYLLWKVKLYARLLRAPPKNWVRTERD